MVLGERRTKSPTFYSIEFRIFDFHHNFKLCQLKLSHTIVWNFWFFHFDEITIIGIQTFLSVKEPWDHPRVPRYFEFHRVRLNSYVFVDWFNLYPYEKQRCPTSRETTSYLRVKRNPARAELNTKDNYHLDKGELCSISPPVPFDVPQSRPQAECKLEHSPFDSSGTRSRTVSYF